MPRAKVDAALKPFHPLVRRWFADRVGTPSAPQRQGWPAIARGEHTLILAPTGTGKTLAAFLWELNALITEGERHPLANAVHILYVSPLKALGNDVQKNLERPLDELRAAFGAAGRELPEIRTAVRTGDTPAKDRARMVRKSPHVLITTPESLHILLTTPRARTMFSHVRAVIVDEIHAMAGGKRGAHLALTLERLDLLVQGAEGGVGVAPQRIGLSATQRPLEEIARFLGGMEASPGAPPRNHDSAEAANHRHRPDAATGCATRGAPPENQSTGDMASDRHPQRAPVNFRPTTIVDCGAVKRMELTVESATPLSEANAGSIWPAVARLALRHVRTARTTLVFVNNRAQAERMAARINNLAGEELAQPYHGSLAKERRLYLEDRLKAGELRALVTTSSLELGIDVGSVDLVLQLQSPKRVSAGLQRLGRAGHSLEAVSRGVFVPTHREDALEIAALVAAMRDGDVEPTKVVQNALDVLAQVLVAAASVDDWTADGLYDLARRSYPYHRLTRGAFDEVLAMLAGKYPSDVAAALEPKLTWDRVSGAVRAPRSSRLTAVTNAGTIPDRGLYAVYLGDKTRLGELDEEFVHESRVGDAFQLGSSTWRITGIEHDRVTVQPAPGAPARMPFWHGEFLSRDPGLAGRVGDLRRALDGARTGDDLARIAQAYDTDTDTAREMAEYVAQQRAMTGTVPDERTLLVEHFRDETGAVRVVLHSPYGGRVHAPWGMALAQRVREALGERADVQVQTGDDGIMLRLPELGREPPLATLLDLTPDEAERRVIDEVGASSLFGARFRMAAARALLMSRGAPGRRMPLWLQRLKALDLLEAVRQYPAFPIIVETYREVLQDAFDIEAMRRVLGELVSGRIRVQTARTEYASPFAHGLEFGFVIDNMYGDDTPRAEQRASAATLDRSLLDEVLGTEVRDDDTRVVLARVVAERQGAGEGRRARTADELAVILERAGDLTEPEIAARVESPALLRELLETGRVIGIAAAGSADDANRTTTRPDHLLLTPTEHYARWLSAEGEHVATVRAGPSLASRDAADVVPEALRHATLTRGAARREILARHVADHGPVTVREIVARYGWPADWVGVRLAEWQRSGRLVRGVFRREIAEPEWCSTRLVETARRRALDALRKSVQAIPFTAFAAFLQRWQRLDPRDRMEGREGTREVLGQLAGIARPGHAWERHYLPARLAPYDPASLAGLCATGEVAWLGESGDDTARQNTSGIRALARVRFVERGEAAPWLRGEPPAPESLSPDARTVLAALERLGASFTTDLAAATGLRPLLLHEALRELVAAALVTNDTAEALREVLRTPPMPPRAETTATTSDEGRWLPSSFTPTPGRPSYQRPRPNVRSLPRWRRPDLDTAPGAGRGAGWTGRWSLARTPGLMGPGLSEEEQAERVARQWLARYGVVSRDWWRRERPAPSWRAIYRELKRLEMRGEVRRGYFVDGLAGAQFALPEVVERLRLATEDPEPPVIVMASSDPANVHALPADQGMPRDPLGRPRGAGAVVVTRAGRVVIAAENGGKRLRVAHDAREADVREAAAALSAHLLAAPSVARRLRDLEVNTIDGVPAATSRWASAFADAGYRRGVKGLRWMGRFSS